MIEDRIKIVKDELLDMKVDAIVNPTDEYFSGSDGLDKLIQKNAGEKLSKKLSKSGPCQVGQCIINKGYDLSVKSILNVIGLASRQSLLSSIQISFTISFTDSLIDLRKNSLLLL